MITFPAANRVFQKWPQGYASFRVEWRGNATHAVLRNQSGTQVNATVAGHSGYPTMMNNVAPGWYDLELVDGTLVVDTIKVGVGDVYAVIGQSNSVSQRQPASFNPIVPPAGRVILSNYYADGAGMHTFIDPAVHVMTGAWAGVAWIYCALALNRPHPIMFVMVGKGNQSYYDMANWQQAPGVPDPRLWTAYALYQPKAFLWHQGESECPQGGPPRSDTFLMMDAIISSLRNVTATPMVIAVNSTSYAPPPGYAEWPCREVQRSMCAPYGKWAHCKRGPDTDAIRTLGDVEYLGQQLQAHGELWASKLIELAM
jgi:hypothetical protein